MLAETVNQNTEIRLLSFIDLLQEKNHEEMYHLVSVLIVIMREFT